MTSCYLALAPPTGTPPPCDCLLSADLLFLRLLPYASKWQSLGEALSLDDDRLDEIFTNNETDEACLREMVELYMMRSDLDHSWEEIEHALKNPPIASGELHCKYVAMCGDKITSIVSLSLVCRASHPWALNFLFFTVAFSIVGGPCI